MSLSNFLNKLNNTPLEVSFQDTMSVVDENYTFSETKFTNGDTVNEAGQNNGSCKLFAFALANKLTIDQTLNCFGDFYRKDVLDNPEGDNHQNIRNFIKSGFEGITFEGEALQKKA